MPVPQRTCTADLRPRGHVASIGVIIAIYLQNSELKLQRQELEDTRKEIKRQATAQEKSLKSLDEQAKTTKVISNISILTSLLEYHEPKLYELIKWIS